MKTNVRMLIFLLFLAGLYITISTGCKKTNDADTQPRGRYGYIYNDSSSKPISGVLIIGYLCYNFDPYSGCIGTPMEYDRSTTDTNGFFQLVYDPDSYTFYIMGYEVKRIDYANNIYYVRHW
jgi:hypothetical protein